MLYRLIIDIIIVAVLGSCVWYFLPVPFRLVGGVVVFAIALIILLPLAGIGLH